MTSSASHSGAPFSITPSPNAWIPQKSPPASPPQPATHTISPGDPAAIDLAVLAELVGDDRENIRRFALKFIESTREDITGIEEALERKDMVALSSLGHRAKSPANMAGALGMRDLCQSLEDLKGSSDFARSEER